MANWKHVAFVEDLITVVYTRQFIFTIEGSLTVIANPFRICNKTGATLTILGVYLLVDTAPTGSNIIVDVNKNGTTIFTVQANRPEIVAGDFYGCSIDVDVTGWQDGEYLQIDLDQIGSTIAGSNLSVHVTAR
jgi:hypothetical protein